eukprot:500447-Hanusia_phi.AAC.1
MERLGRYSLSLSAARRGKGLTCDCDEEKQAGASRGRPSLQVPRCLVLLPSQLVAAQARSAEETRSLNICKSRRRCLAGSLPPQEPPESCC